MEENGQGLVEYALSLVLIAVVVVIILSLVNGFLNPTPRDIAAIPPNVTHSEAASRRVHDCVRSSVVDPARGSATIYPHEVIECLYASGFEIRYNGEPVRYVESE